MMIRSTLILCCIGLPTLLFSQNKRVKVEVHADYNGRHFLELVDSMEKSYDLQFYFFPGWVTDVLVKQEKHPAFLTDILESTFAGTEYNVFINSNQQVILTLGATVQPELYLIDSVPVAQTKTQKSIEKSSLFDHQFGDFETQWTVIGDPTTPEPKPKVILGGQVYAANNNAPLSEVIVFVQELKTGTKTDSLGRYELSLPQGSYEIIFQSIGLKEAKRQIKIYESGVMDVPLDELILDLEEVVVMADRKESIRGVQMGVEALKTATIKELPTLLGEVDIIRSALMLPGVQSTGEFSAGINVRGGGADQNLILLNGAPVFNASHLFGFSSAFSPDVIDGFELYKSSIPAKFGGRISSVLDIKMREGNPEKWMVRGGISPVTSRITLEGPIEKERSSIIISGRATYSDWILKRLENASYRNSTGNYYDVSAHYITRISQNNRLDVSTYLSHDNFRLNADTSYSYQNRNIVANYVHAFSQKLYGTFTGVYSNYQFNVSSYNNPNTSFDLSYQINYLEGKAHFSYAPETNHQVNFGINLVNYRLNPGNIEPHATESQIISFELEPERALEGSIYISDEWAISELFSLYGGLRYVHYFFLGPQSVNNYKQNEARIGQNIIGKTDYKSGQIIKDYGGAEYRVSLRYSLSDNSSIKFAFNRNRQYLSMLFNSATVSPTATWKLSDSHILPQTGDQFSIGFFRNLWDDQVELSVESYYKLIQDMLEYKAGAELILNENIESDLVNGSGKSYGVEFLLKKHGRKLNGWLSYTYSRTMFRTDSPYTEEQINRGSWFPSNFDKPHDFSLTGYYKVSRRFSLSGNVLYSSGRPITVPVAKYVYANGIRLQYSQRNEFRVPDYFRCDISMNLEGNHKLKKLAHSSWSLSLYNVTGRQNAYSIYFISDGVNAQGYKLSIFGKPFLTLTYNFRF